MSESIKPTLEQHTLKKDHLEPFKIALIAVEVWLAWIAVSELFYDDLVTFFSESIKTLISAI